MALSNITRIETLLLDPVSDITLEELRAEMNELAKLRHGARLSFCKRLAVAYLKLIGHRPAHGSSDGSKFRAWCNHNLLSATGKRYSSGTIDNYLKVGFSANPEKYLKDDARARKRRDERMRKLGGGLARAIANGGKVVPITRLKSKHKLSGDVAGQVNALMKAWEEAAPHARAQFIYMVTGSRLGVSNA
jgi:hypothetical protein